MQDLNDLRFFARVVEHGGFAAASRALNIPRSKLSRRVADLEDQLNVRLIQRSTRSFSVTDLGQRYYEHVSAMLSEAAKAEEVLELSRDEPSGTIRLACPAPLLQNHVGQVIAQYLLDFPHVNISIEATNEHRDLIEEGYDLALRFWMQPTEGDGFIAKKLGSTRLVLCAGPALLQGRVLEKPQDLAALPTIAGEDERVKAAWPLKSATGETFVFEHRPRLACGDFATMKAAAVAGIGVTFLPSSLVADELAGGQLVHLLPEWSLPPGAIYALFPTRKGLTPAVRSLLNVLEGSIRGHCL